MGHKSKMILFNLKRVFNTQRIYSYTTLKVFILFYTTLKIFFLFTCFWMIFQKMYTGEDKELFSANNNSGGYCERDQAHKELQTDLFSFNFH